MRTAAGVALGTRTFKPTKLGGQGFLINGPSFSDDGATMAAGMDTYDAYVRTSGSDVWRSMFTASALLPAEQGKLEGSFTDTDGRSVENVDKVGGYDVCVAPSNSQIIYSARGGFIYKSTDAGVTSRRTAFAPVAMHSNNGTQRLWAPKLAVDPADPNHVIFGTENQGAWETLNGGDSWTQIAGITLAAGANARYDDKPAPMLVVFVRGSGVTSGRTNGVLIVSYGIGVFKRTAAAGAFSLIAGSPTAISSMSSGPTGIVWMTAVVPANGSSSVFKYSAGALAMVPSPNLPLSAITAHFTNANLIVGISSNGYVVATTDGGTNWTGPYYEASQYFVANKIPFMGGYTGRVFPGQLRFHPITGELWMTHGTGVCRAVFPPATYQIQWIDETQGFEQLVSNKIFQPPLVTPAGGKTHADPILCVWDKGPHILDNPEKYPVRHEIDAFGAAWDGDYDATDPSFVVILDNHFSNESGFSRTYGRTPYVKLADHPGGYAAGGAMALSNKQMIWLPSQHQYGVFCLNVEAGSSCVWTRLAIPGLPSGGDQGWSFAVYNNRKNCIAPKASPGTFLAYNYGAGDTDAIRNATRGIWKFTNSFTTAVRIFAGAPAGTSGGDPYAMDWKEKPGTSEQYMSVGGHQSAPLIKSLDGGVSWTGIAGTSYVNCFGFGKGVQGSAHPALYLVGTVNGVYGLHVSLDNCATWTFIVERPHGNLDGITCVSGDMNIFGRVHLGYSGSGAGWGDFQHKLLVT